MTGRRPYNPRLRPCGVAARPRFRMFDKLADRLGKAVEGLRGRGRLTEENIADTLRQVRMALLEADVALPVVKEFIDAARARAIGAEVTQSLTPGQALIKHHPRGTDARDGRAACGAQPAHAAAGRDPARRPAGRRQDDDGGQDRALADRDSERKRVLLASTDVYRPGGDAAARAARAQLGVDVLRGRRRARCRSRSRPPRVDHARHASLRRPARRHRRPTARRRRR